MNVTPMRITVITPSFNQAEFLERTICSVLDQGYDNLEYIVVDGDSSDGSDEIIGYYHDRLTVLKCKPETGPAEAINQGLARATGQYVAVLTADNLYLPDALHHVAEAVAGNPQWVVGHLVRIGERDQPLGELRVSEPHSLLDLLMHNSGFLPALGAFYRREVLERVGGFDARLRGAFDYELACRLISRNVSPTILACSVAAQREHDEAFRVRFPLELGREYIRTAEQYAERLPLHERAMLWRNCDLRRRIYALAESEAAGTEARRFLWQQLLRRPWWLASDHYRQKLLVHGGQVARHAA